MKIIQAISTYTQFLTWFCTTGIKAILANDPYLRMIFGEIIHDCRPFQLTDGSSESWCLQYLIAVVGYEDLVPGVRTDAPIAGTSLNT